MAGAREGPLNIAALLNGGSATINTSLLMLPLAVGVMSRAAVPLLLHVNYTAGFLPYSFNPDTDDLGTACPDFENIHIVADGVRALTAIKILTNTRFAKGAGGGSIAVDGISQTHAPGRFAQEIATLGEDVKAAKSALSASMRGLNFMFA
jgi:hypothetical protein